MTKKHFLADKKNIKWYVIIAILVVISIFFVKKEVIGRYGGVQNKGVNMRIYASDEYGNILYEISMVKAPQPFAVVSYGETSEIIEYIVIESTLSNTGETDIIFTTVRGSNPCVISNTNPDCSTVPNNYGGTTTGDEDGDGDIDGLYAARFAEMKNNELLLKPEESDMPVRSEAINVNELTAGYVEPTLEFNGYFIDERGQRQPLEGVKGSIVLHIQSESCSDGTAIGECSLTQRGKKCELSQGNPPLVNFIDSASVCGCCLPGEEGYSNNCGWIIDGDKCYATRCAKYPNQCLPGTITFCLEGGSEESRCNQCGYKNCEESYYKDESIGCEPIGKDPSVCDYPNRATSASVNLGYGGQTGKVINFRTTHLKYDKGGAIAYTESCGEELVPYGYYDIRKRFWSEDDCDSANLGQYIMDIPGGWLDGGNPVGLYQPPYWGQNKLYVCDDSGTGGYEYKIYNNKDSDKWSADTSPILLDSKMEVKCD